MYIQALFVVTSAHSSTPVSLERSAQGTPGLIDNLGSAFRSEKHQYGAAADINEIRDTGRHDAYPR